MKKGIIFNVLVSLLLVVAVFSPLYTDYVAQLKIKFTYSLMAESKVAGITFLVIVFILLYEVFRYDKPTPTLHFLLFLAMIIVILSVNISYHDRVMRITSDVFEKKSGFWLLSLSGIAEAVNIGIMYYRVKKH